MAGAKSIVVVIPYPGRGRWDRETRGASLLLYNSRLEPLDLRSELLIPPHHTSFLDPRETKGAEVAPTAPTMLPA